MYSCGLSSKIQLQRKTKTVLAFELSVLLTRSNMITKAIGYVEEGGQVQKPSAAILKAQIFFAININQFLFFLCTYLAV